MQLGANQEQIVGSEVFMGYAIPECYHNFSEL
jgi:hypothetical protein